MVLPAELRGRAARVRFAARPRSPDGPGVERFPAAVLFADISGFTPLAERLARRGPAGAEALSTLLNAYFPQLTALIAAHRGELLTVAGDGLQAVWPATQDDEGLAAATCDAGRCAQAVQSALGCYQTDDGLRLLLRIGIGAGEVMALRVGGAGGRWQLLLSGAPVVQGGLAEQQAARGEVVLSPEAWELAHDRCAGERLAAGQAERLAELRRVTAVFVNLLDVDPAVVGLLEPVQQAMAAIQVKGKADPVAAYRPVEPAGKVDGSATVLGRAGERTMLAA